MTDRERAICARLKQFRELIRWSQAEFSKKIEISRPRLVSIEYGHTPLRFDLAIKICKHMDVSALWLASGSGKMSPYVWMTIAKEMLERLGENPLLSEVYDLHPDHFCGLKTSDVSKLSADEFPFDFDLEKSLPGRILLMLQKVKHTESRFAGQLFIDVVAFVTNRLKEDHRRKRLISCDPKQYSTFLRYFKPEHELYLQDVSDFGNNSAVKAKLPALIKRLNEATKERGSKTALAKFIGVPLPKISQWLAGEHEPGGETTLRLLQWVEQQERQK